MDITLFWVVFVFFGMAYFAVAMYSSRKVDTNEEYFFAGRQYTTLTITLTLVATQLGAGAAIGTADEAYYSGFYGILYNLGVCIGLLILSMGIAGKLRRFNISTTAELFETKYKSVILRRLASILSIITLGGILAGQIVASRKLIGTFTEDFNFLLTCFWLAVIFYTMFGGLKAVVATDIFQVIIIVLVFAGALGYVLFTHDSAITFSWPTLSDIQNKHFSTDNLPIAKMIGFLLMPILFSLIEQDLAQRFFAAKNQKVAVMSALFAAVAILFFSFIPLYFGMEAQLVNLEVGQNASVLLASIQHLVGGTALILIVCALIAAICSTADSLLCAIGSNIIYDFNLNTTAANNYGLAISRIATFLTGIAALIVAHFFDSIIEIITRSYELSVSCLFVPLFFCYFRKTVYKEAALASFCCGLFGFIAFQALPIAMPREIASLILALIGYIAGHNWGKLLARQESLNRVP